MSASACSSEIVPGVDVLGALGAIFDGLGIRAVVIGATAANRYRREVRLTGDLDLLVGSHGPGLERLEGALRAAGWSVERGTPDGAVLRARHATLGVVDLLLAETDYQRLAIERASIERRADGTTLRVLRIEDVLVHKLIAGRARDRADIEDILACRPELDVAYVERWAEYWDVLSLWYELRREVEA